LRPLLEIADSNCHRLETLVNEIVDIDKIEEGRFGLNLEPTEIFSLIGEAIGLNHAYAEK